jgi:hypothetical protein
VFILVSLKTSPLPIVQGRLFGIGQSKAHPWLHVLVVVLRATLRTLGEAPTRSWTELAQRLGVAEADAGALVEWHEKVPHGEKRAVDQRGTHESPSQGEVCCAWHNVRVRLTPWQPMI